MHQVHLINDTLKRNGFLDCYLMFERPESASGIHIIWFEISLNKILEIQVIMTYFHNILPNFCLVYYSKFAIKALYSFYLYILLLQKDP